MEAGRLRIMAITLLCGLVGTSCGSSSSDNNDQGISFRAVGIFQGSAQGTNCTVPTADSAIADASISLILDDPLLDVGYPNANTAFLLCRAYLWLQNDLFNQAINVERIDFEYEIPGAQIPIPRNSSPTGIRISPANADPEQAVNPFGQVNVWIGHLEGQLVPASLILFQRQNQLSLPQLPYVMIIHVTAQGRTDSGEVIVSNEVRYTIEWN